MFLFWASWSRNAGGGRNSFAASERSNDDIARCEEPIKVDNVDVDVVDDDDNDNDNGIEEEEEEDDDDDKQVGVVLVEEEEEEEVYDDDDDDDDDDDEPKGKGEIWREDCQKKLLLIGIPSNPS